MDRPELEVASRSGGVGQRDRREWQARTTTVELVLETLRSERSSRPVLDLGCGNGWMTVRLGEALESYVVGADVVLGELAAGEHVFGRRGLAFVAGDVVDARLFKRGAFGWVVMAASIQYFPRLDRLFSAVAELLADEGKLLICDSPFYERHEVVGARTRSTHYYREMGVAAMAEHYHHHAVDELVQRGARWIRRPNSVSERFRRHVLRQRRSPFPVVVLDRSGLVS